MRLRILVIMSAVCVAMSSFVAYAYVSTSLTTVFAQIEQEYGLPSGTLAKIANVESGGNPTAGSPGRAYGMFQWFAKYWQPAAYAVYHMYIDPSQRANPTVAAKVTAYALAQAKYQNGALIQGAHLDMTLGLYLNHFLGIAGARKFLQLYIANPQQPASLYFAKEASYNPAVFNGRTLAGVVNYFAQKLQVAGTSVNVAGTFSDMNGISYAYSNADLPLGSYQATPYAVSSFDPWTYPTTYAPSQSQSLVLPRQLTPTPVRQILPPAPPTGTQQPKTGVLPQNAGTGAPSSQNEISNVGTGVASSSTAGSPPLLTGPSPAAILIAQPQYTTVGIPVLLAWASVGMSTQTPCSLTRSGLGVASGNSGTQLVPTKGDTSGPLMFVLSCTSSAGASIQQSATVTLQ